MGSVSIDIFFLKYLLLSLTSKCSLFSVAPVLNKLTKGRQKPEEFYKNAEILYEDVKVALDDARRRKLAARRLGDEQDSIVPGPPPESTRFSRIVVSFSAG